MAGTNDLGQLILKSLSDKHGIGNGLMLGLWVAFNGLAVDQILRTWANERLLISRCRRRVSFGIAAATLPVLPHGTCETDG